MEMQSLKLCECGGRVRDLGDTCSLSSAGKATWSQAGLSVADEQANPGLLYEVSKRFIDIVVSSVAITILAPVLIILAVLVKVTSAGPILFRQRRLGRGGCEFWCYKFRTMVVDAEQRLDSSEELRTQFDQSFKLRDDPRMTRFGSILRKTSLDELPQLFHIVGGSMSLIGPRPIVPMERAKYSDLADKLLMVKPGLGGYWQGHRRNDTTYDERIAMDMLYVDSRSFSLDLRLMVRTVVSAIRRHGAH